MTENAYKKVSLSNNIPVDAKCFAEMWDFYRTRVMPPDAGDVQRTETKRAFYLGAMLFRIVMENAPEDADEAGQIAYCDALEAEFDSFMAQDLAENYETEGTA